MTDMLQLQRRLRMALRADDHETAIACLQATAHLAHQVGDRAAEGRHLGNLALVYYRSGQPEMALKYFEQALALARAEADQATEDGLLGNMGNILRELGRYDDARHYLEAALALAREIGDVRGRGIWLSNLGVLCDDLGQHEAALAYHSQAIAVARQLQDQRGLANRLRKLTDSLLAAGNPLEALKCLGEALTIYTAINDQSDLLEGLILSGDIHATLSQQAAAEPMRQIFLDNASQYYHHALALAQAQQDRLTAAGVLVKWGQMQAGEPALTCWQQARDLYAELHMPEQVSAIEDYIRQSVVTRSE
jgi:tetratricopeptide (TPR) repeat protein